MTRVLIFPVLCLSLMGGACSRKGPDEAAAFKQSAAAALPDKDQMEVTGCLTANRETNQFVLTANTNTLTSLTSRAAATGEVETFHYQLVGGTNLQNYVGKEVVVKGSVEGKGADVNIEMKEKTEAPAVKSRGEDVTPAIESKQEIELQVERLNVASVTPTGAACQIGKR